jgi:replicative DNA helicase
MTTPFQSSVATERSILGAILLESKSYDEAVSGGLIPEDLSLDSHRRIFRAMMLLAESSSAIDLVTLVHHLEQNRELAPVGGAGYIASLVDGLPDRPSIRHYIRIVKEKAAQRKLHAACTTVSAGLEAEMNSGDAIEYLTDKMLQVQTGSDDSPAHRVIEFSEQTYSDWLELAKSDSDLVGLSTGVSSVDMATTGIRESEFWIYGGRKGDGKTNLVLQTIAANCREDIPVAMFSIEMTKESLLQRLWAGESGVDSKHIRFPRRLPAEMTRKIELAMTEVARWPLFIVEESSIALSKLTAKAKLLIRREGIKLIVVDYVQLIGTHGKDEKERLTKISHTLMGLAKDSGVPVVALSQLSRPKDGNENFRPTSFNLKESGSLENDAHVIVLIYRPVDERKMKTNEDELIIDKQRAGQSSIENVCFMPWLRFHERMTG